MEIDDLLQFARKNDASDIHIATGNPPIFRVVGEMVPMRLPPMEAEQVKALLQSVMNKEQCDRFEAEKEIDFAFHIGENNRFRVNAFYTLRGPAAVFRSVPTVVKTLKDINTPPIVEQLCSLQQGLILVTGATGSGKSTTVAAMIHYMNQHYAKHIITLEDPVEFVHRSDKSLINHREIGVHTSSYARALKSALRENPDIILVGELRDLETISAALTAAETGHLVIATLHTSSAAQTIDRMIDVFPANDKDMVRTMLSAALEAVISQRLIRTKDGKSRVPAFEILVCTPAVRNLIRDNKVAQISSLIQVGSRYGMVSMKESIDDYVKSGIISSETASIALNKGEDTEKDATFIQGTTGAF